MKKLLLLLLLSLPTFAKINEMKIEGIIIAFNKSYVTVQNDFGQKTNVPRNLFQEKITTGEFVRLILNDKQISEMKKLSTKN